MQLSIIILNYNVCYFLKTCVISVQQAIAQLDAEIIVVDNNSSDDSCKMMKTDFPHIQLIINTHNEGFPKGNNIGVNEAKGDYICILNPDTIIAEDTFVKILNFINNHPQKSKIGIVGCKLIDGAGYFLPESKRGIPTPWVSFTKISGLYKFFTKSSFFNRYYAQHINENETAEVAILVGAFMILKRNLYNQLGGFDENCFMYADDIDLSYMSLKKGFVNYYFHQTTVIHYKGESTIKDQQYMQRFQNAMHFFYKKHFKISPVFTLFMKTGIILFSITKMFSKKLLTNAKPENYLLLSANESLKVVLEKKLQKNISYHNFENGKSVLSQSISMNKKVEVILDLNYISFKEAISFFEHNKNKNVSFKLLPPKSNYIIGSNSSNDRGQIIVL